MNYYKDKVEKYFTNARFDLISLLPNKESKILEIGAGGGDTLVAIKELKLASEVVGVELFDLPGTNQLNPLIDNFIIGNIEKPEFSLPLNYFDFIICGDVLEHLFDPYSVIDLLSKSLKIGGKFIISMPNIRYYKALIKIVFKGDFGYESSGVFDKTHTRFFCKKNMVELFNKEKYHLSKVLPLNYFSNTKGLLYYFNKLTFHLFEEFLNTQYVLVVAKK